MYSTYQFNADEMTEDFIKIIREKYKGRKIEIMVREIKSSENFYNEVESEMDDTA